MAHEANTGSVKKTVIPFFAYCNRKETHTYLLLLWASSVCLQAVQFFTLSGKLSP